jgi:hypothetical protein
MTSLSRKQNAEAVLAQLRGVGPQTKEQIRSDLGMTKSAVEDALWLLMNRDKIEYAGPGAPLTYKVVTP